MNRGEAYEKIIHRAVPIANNDPRMPFYLVGIFGPPPRDPEVLEVWYDPNTVHGAIVAAKNNNREVRSEEEIMRSLTLIVRDAVQKAIRMEPEALGYLMLEQIRNAAVTRANGTI